jgi:2-iminobutanoate/2-iminopropanoate deaminase
VGGAVAAIWPQSERVKGKATVPNSTTDRGACESFMKQFIRYLALASIGVGEHIWLGRTAGVDPATGHLAGAEVGAQTRQIFKSFKVMLDAVGSDLSHVTHIDVFLEHMSDFEAMNAAYVEMMGDHRPARTVFSAQELPKPGVLLTMNLTAVTRER